MLWTGAATIALLLLTVPDELRAQTAGPDPLREPFQQPLHFFDNLGLAAANLEDRICDPTWDGALFGVLPGVGVSFLVAGFRASNRESNDDLIIWLGAGAGALIGWGIDAARCVTPEPEAEPDS